MSATINAKIGLSDADKAQIGTDIETKYTKRLTNCEEALGLGERILLGVKFYGNSTSGTRTHQASTITNAGVGLTGGDKASNDCDSMWPWNQMKRVSFLARDSNGNGLKGTDGEYIYNQFVRIPMFWARKESGTDTTGSYVEYLITNKAMDGYEPIHRNDDGSIPSWFFMSAYWATYLDGGSVAYYGCQRGQSPRVDIHANSLKASMSYVKEPEYGIASNTQLHAGEPLNFIAARFFLSAIEFASRDTKTKFLGVIYDNYQWVSESPLQSHNTMGSSTNKLCVSSSSVVASHSSVGSKVMVTVLDGRWYPCTITALAADTDVSGAASGFTLLTLDKSFTFTAGSYDGATLMCGAPVGDLDDMLSSSGSAVVNDGYHHCSYRGLEDATGGNLWNQIIRAGCKDTYDGTNSINYLALYEPGQTETDITTFTQTSQTWAIDEGWVLDVALFNNNLVTTTVGASSSTYYRNYYWRSVNTSTTPFYREILAGGNAGSGGNCGLLSFYCANGWGAPDLHYGSRPSILL